MAPRLLVGAVMRSILALTTLVLFTAGTSLAACGKAGDDIPNAAAPTGAVAPANPAASAQQPPCDDTATATNAASGSGVAAGGGGNVSVTGGGGVTPPVPPQLPKPGQPPRDTGDPPPRPPCKK